MKRNLKKRLLEWCPQPKGPTLKLNQTVVHNPFNRRLTITKIALITLVAVVGFFAFIQIYVPARYHPTYAIRAEELTEMPTTYFVLDTPDAIVSQAIANPETSVQIDTFEDTQIDELIREHNTGNVQINSRYYQIGIMYGDSFPPIMLSRLYLISIFALPVFGIAVALLSALLIGLFLQRKKRNISGSRAS